MNDIEKCLLKNNFIDFGFISMKCYLSPDKKITIDIDGNDINIYDRETDTIISTTLEKLCSHKIVSKYFRKSKIENIEKLFIN